MLAVSLKRRYRERFYNRTACDTYEIMTEKEKMLAGMEYSAVDPQLLHELNEVKEIIINQPFYCDYGKENRKNKRSQTAG